MRARFFYEKRGFACFVPHVALSTLFSRAARRAGVELERTEGFSPRPKISFGPELPAGVVALCEPADLWIKNPREGNWRDFLSALPEVFNAQMPDGFRVIKCVFPGEGTLGRECRAARYLLRAGELSAAEILARMKNYYGEAFLNGKVFLSEESFLNEEEFLNENVLNAEGENFFMVSAVLADPAQNGIGGFVKALTADGAVAGWSGMRVARTGLGRWNGGRMEPMEEAVSRFDA